MNRRPDVPLWARAVAAAFDAMTEATSGFRLPFSGEIVKVHGVVGMVRLMAALAKLADRLTARYGVVNAQVLIGLSAMWSGCEFCSRGHLLAANLYYLQDTGRLFQLDDALVPELQRKPDGEALAVILRAFEGPEHERLRALCARQFELKAGEPANETDDDTWLKASVAAWEWWTECSIVATGDDVPPTTPIAKNKVLIARYREARRGAGANADAATHPPGYARLHRDAIRRPPWPHRDAARSALRPAGSVPRDPGSER
jgi:hypothetical protein